MGPIWDAELRVWDAKNFGPVSPGTHRNKFVKKSLYVSREGVPVDNCSGEKCEPVMVFESLDMSVC